jgi:hypothetical protein
MGAAETVWLLIMVALVFVWVGVTLLMIPITIVLALLPLTKGMKPSWPGVTLASALGLIISAFGTYSFQIGSENATMQIIAYTIGWGGIALGAVATVLMLRKREAWPKRWYEKAIYYAAIANAIIISPLLLYRLFL